MVLTTRRNRNFNASKFIEAALDKVYGDLYNFQDDSVGRAQNAGYHSSKIKDEAHYPCIPFSTYGFTSLIAQEGRVGGSFIDVGCGIGDKAYTAWLRGMVAHGIEYTPVTYRTAKAKVGHRVKVIHGDAKMYDFSKHDLIYSYCPIRDPHSFMALTDNIIGTMKVGAVWVEVLPAWYHLYAQRRGLPSLYNLPGSYNTKSHVHPTPGLPKASYLRIEKTADCVLLSYENAYLPRFAQFPNLVKALREAE